MTSRLPLQPRWQNAVPSSGCLNFSCGSITRTKHQRSETGRDLKNNKQLDMLPYSFPKSAWYFQISSLLEERSLSGVNPTLSRNLKANTQTANTPSHYQHNFISLGAASFNLDMAFYQEGHICLISVSQEMWEMLHTMDLCVNFSSTSVIFLNMPCYDLLVVLS